jgi:tRNA(Ile)-lysidine synthase
MLSGFEKKVSAFISAGRLFGDGEKVLLAVSGGADSVALMFTMLRLKEAQIINAEFAVGHVNHKLRGRAADEDEEFVLDLGKKAGIEVVTRSVDVGRHAKSNKLSVETAARKLRASALIDIADLGGCKLIATAHHKDDNAETMVHRLVRGTGFRGLGGIWPKRMFECGAEFVRPLLCVTREEIVQYCKANNLTWRHDHTNYDHSYTRNRIRHLLLPELQRGCDGLLVAELAQLSKSCQGLYNRVCREVEQVWPVVVLASEPGKVVLDKKVFAAQAQIIRAELARRAVVSIGSGERDLKEAHYRQIMDLAHRAGGRRIELPGGFVVAAQYEKISFYKSEAGGGPRPTLQTILKIPGLTEVADYTIGAEVVEAKDCDVEKFKAEKNKFVEWIDFDKLAGPVVVRKRDEGDRFQPLGGVGTKKIGKFLTAQKVPLQLRRKLLVVADNEKIIWLAPLRPSELTRVTAQTKQILQLQIHLK